MILSRVVIKSNEMELNPKLYNKNDAVYIYETASFLFIN